ncbi:unnamed protein product [Arctia plantaginis]|uniref:Uncharacterized protein n=1 Tax=Arctia plantaginis TaxID=874455 RepID=A0A8S1AYS0_ARCPL|nr:unnamed protein product [Arctia plantaginis]
MCLLLQGLETNPLLEDVKNESIKVEGSNSDCLNSNENEIQDDENDLNEARNEINDPLVSSDKEFESEISEVTDCDEGDCKSGTEETGSDDDDSDDLEELLMFSLI